MKNTDLSLDSFITRSDSILFTELVDEVVMMDIQNGCYYGLEEPASRLWELMVERISVRQLCERLHSEYEVEMPQCEQEVLEFVADLSSRSMVEIS